ncbi:hypothetical protein SCATT_49810 [Streptantibioticus cattleyicolor NRRL 8057 = DSM 46488]|uniref:Uncharacterized protein n=1 Tax=Streptantibioticus cattleyicolor (strain ATCC 35852 / DSM 46488 / JCM 4925 / NBRC 14057 / NRRL 8057) TaxID=1003195 RepID=G8X0W3_STREN|nr:hypothetical protein SCATT_49810 [Streptantibioticus cattleyicolor NRRL 8057 = DSM 46488]
MRRSGRLAGIFVPLAVTVSSPAHDDRTSSRERDVFSGRALVRDH